MRKLRSRFLYTNDVALLFQLERLASEHSARQLQLQLQQERNVLNNSNPRILSQLVRSRAPSNSSSVLSLASPDGILTGDTQTICELLNQYFVSCYSSPSNLITADSDHNSYATTSPGERFNADFLHVIPVHVNDIVVQLRTLKSSCFAGPDGIPSTPLIYGGPDIPFLLSNLFNLSLEQGIVPTQWKQSLVTPRYKSGPRTLATSYRGIHHTSILSRILERLIKTPLIMHLKARNLISDRQHGFLSRRSVISCQIDFFHHISLAYDRGQQIIVIFLDITKAFDRVPHQAMIEALQSAGISNPLLRWFESYFSGRTQATVVSGCTSSLASIPSGVIQGSVLGPIFFLLYINKALSQVHYGEPFVFADDIKLVYTLPSNTVSVGLQHIQSDLDSLHKWSTSSGLHFSPSKCSVITCRFPSAQISLRLNGVPLPVVPVIRDLGVRYTSLFSFSHQALYQIAKARKLCFLILRSFHLTSLKLLLYKQRVRPILEYCTVLFSNYSQHDRHAIERVQRTFTKALLPNSCLDSYRARCAQFNLEPLWLRRLKLNLGTLYRLLHSQLHTSVAKPTFLATTGYMLRDSACKLPHPLAVSTLRHNYFIPMYSRIWNKLPAHLRTLDNHRLFARKLDAFFTLEQVEKLLSTQLSLDALFEKGPGNV
jgi:hypothetical protein